MADSPVSGFTAASEALADGDLFGYVDVSDTSAHANGTTKKIPASTIKTYMATVLTSTQKGTYGHMSGLHPVWVNATTLGVTPGSCYIEDADDVIYGDPADITPSSPTADTWYHIYGDVSDLDLEASTTAPVAFATPTGYAMSKTGDPTKRYIYSARTDGSGNFRQFTFQPSTGMIEWAGAVNASPFRVLSAGTASTSTSVDCSAVVPVTARTVFAQCINLGTVAVAFASGDVTVSSTVFQRKLSAGSTTAQVVTSAMSCSATQTLAYKFDSSPTGGAYIDIYGYGLSR